MDYLSLYIHIPFCVKKCHYCDFLSAPCDEDTKQKYVDVLCREITQRAEMFQDKRVDTIFFGGGTPTTLTKEQIEQIMSSVRKGFHILSDAEISMEMNPGTVDREKLKTYKRLGFNRVSIGLQSANDEELRILGRIHTWEEFLYTWGLVREAGFCNVNIDLMSALPGQTLESYEETLQKVLALRPEHISAYSLIVEEGTLFYQWYGEDKEELMEAQNKKLPNESTDRKMYELTKKLLEEKGYDRYEISNYALKGYECRHNIGYWKRKEYLGLGLGASSLLFMKPTEMDKEEKKRGNKECTFVENLRCSNITDLKEYLKIGKEQESNDTNDLMQSGEKTDRNLETNKKWTEEQAILSQTDKMEEFMFLGLRMMEGVSPIEFEAQFGESLQKVYGDKLLKLEKQGLLRYKEEMKKYALTLRGIDVSNQVFAEFLL